MAAPSPSIPDVGQVLAVVSQKGGVGKTTTALNIAAALAQRSVKTLLVDTDPQGAIRYGLGLHATGDRIGLSDYLAGAASLQDIVRPTLLPWLRAVTRDLADGPGIAELVGRARERGYVVVIDTPPGLGPVVHRVLQASQRVLIPLQCEPLALQTTTQILQGVRRAVAVNPSLEVEGILLTMGDGENAVMARVAEYVRAQLPPGMVVDVEIPRSNALLESFAAGQPVVVRDPDDPAARAYGQLVDRLRDRLL
jgi:chromosome partitioning protein